MQRLKLSELTLDSGAREIKVEGELDLAVADQLSEAIDRSDAEQILICLAGCEFVDSTGIAVMVRAHQELSKRGRRLVVHSPAEQVLRVLDVTGLTANGLVF